MTFVPRPDFDPAKIDLSDPSTWAIRPGVDDHPDASHIVLSDEACARIAAVLDRARAQRAREKLRGWGGGAE